MNDRYYLLRAYRALRFQYWGYGRWRLSSKRSSALGSPHCTLAHSPYSRSTSRSRDKVERDEVGQRATPATWHEDSRHTSYIRTSLDETLVSSPVTCKHYIIIRLIELGLLLIRYALKLVWFNAKRWSPATFALWVSNSFVKWYQWHRKKCSITGG